MYQGCFSVRTSGKSDQWVAKTDGTSATNVTNRAGTSFMDTEALMSGDGSTVVYTAEVAGAREVWLVDSDGANKRKITSFGTKKKKEG